MFTYLFRIDPEKWQEFKEAAKDQGHTMRWLIEQFIDDYVAKWKAKRKDQKR